MNPAHCGIVACDVNSHSSASFQFTPEAEDRFDRGSKSKPSAKRQCITILVGLFSTAIILCVAASLALILTQKPVNFDEIEGFTYGDGVTNGNSKLRGTQRRYPERNYISHTYSDVVANQPRPPVTSKWHYDDSILLRQGEHYYKVDANKADTVSSRQLFLLGDQISKIAFEFNSDGRYAALSEFAESGFRHSFKKFYKIAEYDRGRFINRKSVGLTGSEPLQTFVWNPAKGAKDFVYVYNNNIYYQNDPTNPTGAKPLTFTGSETLFYGIADWLYEEEIFNGEQPLWWSKSGNYLAFTMIDDSNITSVEIPMYNADLAIPTYKHIPYPKAGTPHQPSVNLFIWNKEMNVTQLILVPDDLLASGSDSSYYLFRANWISLEADDGQEYDYLVAIWATRDQNTVYITVCQFSVPCRLLKKLNFAMSGIDMWAEPDAFTVKFYSKTGFFLILPHEYSDGNIYDHVAHIEVTKEGKYFPVSGYHGGAYDVTSIVGYDRFRDELFFESPGGMIGDRHLFRVPYASGQDNMAPQCITCLINDCKYSSTSFSPSGTQMLVTCYPPYKNAVVYFKKTSSILEHWILHDVYANGTEYNPSFGVPTTKVESLMLSSGYEAHVSLTLPPNFNSKYTYPVLLDVYAGPGTNKVRHSISSDYIMFFAAVRQYIIVNIDGRGSGGRGWKVRAPMYKNFGGPEIADQLDGLRLLIKKYPFMDPEKVAVIGWSYGGFASGHILAKDGGVTVKCGISIAPVVDFRFYDTAYTERYMLLPEENPKGYAANSLLNDTKLAKFRNIMFTFKTVLYWRLLYSIMTSTLRNLYIRIKTIQLE
ncbi:hypothetical protein FO519_003283 [Halicephalobus sp. NKZ332]|nr:hypothetical protein FO519_003283 [Halicephalobus sp. NKZ332]